MPGPRDELWTPDEADYQSGTPRGDQHDTDPVDTGYELEPSAAGYGTEPSAAGYGTEPSAAGRSGESGGPRRAGGQDRSRSGSERSEDGTGDAGGRRGGRWGTPAPVDASRDPAEVAREICLRLLAVRPRTRAELAAALARAGVAAEVADSVLDRYDEVGIIDDAAFARAWVTSRHHGRGLASRALANELRRKGVDKELAEAALGELDGDTEAATARDLVDRKLRTAGSTPADALFRRLVGMLARKGYPPGLAIRVVKEALVARSDDADYLGEIDPEAAQHLVGDDPLADQPID